MATTNFEDGAENRCHFIPFGQLSFKNGQLYCLLPIPAQALPGLPNAFPDYS
jgi:hypothetical protein